MLRLITRLYKSFKSEVAKRPPSSWKLNEIKNDKELMKSLRNMFNQQEDPNLEVDLNNNKFIRNAERDDDFNQKDPFYTQPGMRDDD